MTSQKFHNIITQMMVLLPKQLSLSPSFSWEYYLSKAPADHFFTVHSRYFLLNTKKYKMALSEKAAALGPERQPLTKFAQFI